jgi:hypothetical protein
LSSHAPCYPGMTKPSMGSKAQAREAASRWFNMAAFKVDVQMTGCSHDGTQHACLPVLCSSEDCNWVSQSGTELEGLLDEVAAPTSKWQLSRVIVPACTPDMAIAPHVSACNTNNGHAAVWCLMTNMPGGLLTTPGTPGWDGMAMSMSWHSQPQATRLPFCRYQAAAQSI